jgi:hypothetical protein
MAIAIIASPSLRAQAVTADFLIKLERTQCYGDCPIYTVTIDAAGNVTYEGTGHVRVLGRQVDRVDASQVAALVATVERIGFFQMDDQYRVVRNPDGISLQVSDLPTTFVTVTHQGRTKRVEDYFNAPAALRELEEQIDEIAGTQRWTRIGEHEESR